MMRENLKTFYLVLFLSTFFMQVQQGLSFTCNADVDNSKSSNKIEIASAGDSVTSEISKKAGRAPYYLIFDVNGVFLKSLTNPSLMRGHGASSGVVNLLLKESVKTVIAGKFGAKMKNLLHTNKVEYHVRAGIVKEIVETFTKNETNKNVQK